MTPPPVRRAMVQALWALVTRGCVGMVLAAGAAGLAGCAGTPPPDWQMQAKGSLERAIDAQLSGNQRVAAAEFNRARGELARTGRPELVARAELLRCAAELASLEVGRCDGFEALRQDAAPPEQAYADHLLGRVLEPARQALLPPAQQALAAWPDGSGNDAARLQAVADPLSRLVGAARWLQAGRASPAVMAVAADTASAQGWRRPLLAWLELMRRQAEKDGRADDAARLARRIALVLAGPATP